MIPPESIPILPGTPAPEFSLPALDTDGEQRTVTLSQVTAESRVVLIFYVDDGMPVCTRELAVFAQEFETLAKAEVRVFGLNTNGIGSHAKFQERDHFPFPLISDFYGEAVKAFGLWDANEGKSRRAVVVIEKGGAVMFVLPHFNPGNVNAVVEVFQALGLT